MTYSFNLIDRKWIPCIKFNGSVEELSLRETLSRAHELRGIQGNSPLETAAFYRLLLAVLHSALRGPRRKSDWAILWNKGFWEPELLNGYLDRWRDRFDLFDQTRPFYQVADERVKSKSVITLAIDMASGNNAALFDHHIEAVGEDLSPAKAARTLIAAQNFGLAGLSGLEQKFTDAPWGRGIIFLVESGDLFKILALNLLLYPSEKFFEQYSSKDKPAWEMDDPYNPARQIPFGYLDYLTWQNRRILLMPEGEESAPIVRLMTMAPGLRQDPSIKDPMKLYRTAKKEGLYFASRFSEERALWRDSDTLFSVKGSMNGYPPKNFDWLAELAIGADEYIPRDQLYQFMALGMANNQAKVEFFHEEHSPLPLEYLMNDELVGQLSTALDFAEQTRFDLRVADQWMALLIISPNSDGKNWQEVDRISKDEAEKLIKHWNVEDLYWQQLEIPFFQLLEDLPRRPEAILTWEETVRQVAWEALEKAANFAGTDASALKAVVRARGQLGYRLKQHSSLPLQEVSE